MTKSLPSNPSLEHLSNQAGDIQKAHAKGDPSVCSRLKALKRFSDFADERILASEMTLADAQFVLAMEYGFKSWGDMKKHVESLNKEVSVMPGGRKYNCVEYLEKLDDAVMERLVRLAEIGDLGIVMQEMPAALKERFLRNMSAVDAAAVGRVQPVGDREADEAHRRVGSVAVREVFERRISVRPTTAMSTSELSSLFVAMTRLGRRDGVRAFDEKVQGRIDDEYIRFGLKTAMAIHGGAPDNFREAMQARKEELKAQYVRRLDMIMTAVDGVREGMNPANLEEKLAAFVR